MEPQEVPALGVGTVHVWILSLTQDTAALAGLLSPDEMNRASRFHFDRDRQRFIAAHGQLRRLLAGYLQRPPQTIRFEQNAYGKPFIHDSHELCFNLSHAGNLALVACARESEIGVDVEPIRMDFPVEDIAMHYFSPAEIAALNALPPHQQHHAFFLCWTRKEAYIKARGAGLAIPLDSFDVTLTPGEPVRLLAARDQPGEVGWSLFDLQPAPGYAGALAVRGQGWTLTVLDAG